jgi:hypothetical protein
MTTTANIIYSFQVFPANAVEMKKDITAANEVRKAKCERLQHLKDTLMLPSGKARKGGRAEVAQAEAEVKDANNECNRLDSLYRDSLSPLLVDLRNKHFRANLSSFDPSKCSDPVMAGKVKHAALLSFDSMNSLHRGESFKVLDNNGLEFNITTQHDGYKGFRVIAGDEPYALGGGDIELQSINTVWTWQEEAKDTIIVDAEKGRFDFTEATPRHGYEVNVRTLKARSLQHNVTMGKVMTALAELGEHLNATDYSNHFTLMVWSLGL